MAKRINPLKVGTRVRIQRDIQGTHQTVQVPNGSQVKVTSTVNILSLGDVGEIEIPRWIPFVGTKCVRVQGEATAVDCLGRPQNIFQVHSTEVGTQELQDAEIVKLDKAQPSPRKRGYTFKKGDRLSANKDLFNFKFDYRYLDIPRYEGDESFALEYPQDESIPFTVGGFNVGYYENGLFIPKSDLSVADRLKLANQRKKLERHYLVQGSFIDKWTYDRETDEAETQERAIWIPAKTVEQRFALWQANNNRQVA